MSTNSLQSFLLGSNKLDWTRLLLNLYLQIRPDFTQFTNLLLLASILLLTQSWMGILIYARSDKLSYEDLARRRAAFNLSRKIREEIAGTDRWKVYVS